MAERTGLRRNKWNRRRKLLELQAVSALERADVLAVLKEGFWSEDHSGGSCGPRSHGAGKRGLKRVTETLGTSFLALDGSVDRKALADVIFRNKDALKTMNSIIHPLVEDHERGSRSGRGAAQIIEAAVFDTAPKDLFDELWYVYTTKENRIIRLMANRGYSREKCEDIIGRQASDKSTARSATRSSTTMGTSPISNDS